VGGVAVLLLWNNDASLDENDVIDVRKDDCGLFPKIKGNTGTIPPSCSWQSASINFLLDVRRNIKNEIFIYWNGL
jgi:hypothetical protein